MVSKRLSRVLVMLQLAGTEKCERGFGLGGGYRRVLDSLVGGVGLRTVPAGEWVSGTSET